MLHQVEMAKRRREDRAQLASRQAAMAKHTAASHASDEADDEDIPIPDLPDMPEDDALNAQPIIFVHGLLAAVPTVSPLCRAGTAVQRLRTFPSATPRLVRLLSASLDPGLLNQRRCRAPCSLSAESVTHGSEHPWPGPGRQSGQVFALPTGSTGDMRGRCRRAAHAVWGHVLPQPHRTAFL